MSETIVRTGGLPPRPDPEQFGYPVRMAVGYARPTVETFPMAGCVCPAGANVACQNPACPRKP